VGLILNTLISKFECVDAFIED
jgi:hypothetical protein